MVKDFWRAKYRAWLASRVIRNGEALQRLLFQRGEYLFAGIQDPEIDAEIDRRERRRDTLLAKLKEAS